MRKVLPILMILTVFSVVACSEQRPGAENSSAQKSQESAAAQQQAQAQQQAPQGVQQVSGTLTNVDTRNKLIAIRTDDGQQMQFNYTDQTDVKGATGTLEGLSKMSGTKLNIQFQSVAGKNTAIQIEVQPAQG